MSKKAIAIIESIAKDVEVGEIYNAKVVRLATFGAFVQLTPSKDALLHISEISYERIDKVEDVLKIGDEIMVKVIGIDDQGKVKVSRKAILPPREGGDQNRDNGRRQGGSRRDRRN